MEAAEREWVTAYLGLGANLGDRELYIKTALRELDALPTMTVVKVSSLYQTAPIGKKDQPEFLNAAAMVRTPLPPEELLAQILHLELRMGRVRNERWGPRVIDVDILAYADAVVEVPGLSIPHPRLKERAFALVPLAEIAPDLVLPGDARSMKILAAEQAKSANNSCESIVSKFCAGAF